MKHAAPIAPSSAVTELKANEAAAVAKFNDKDNKQFRDRDLYVFCFNTSDGKFTAHPNPALMSTDVRALKMRDDPLGQRLFDQVKEGTVTTVSYSFPKPGTTDPAPKESYITRVGGQGCGVGYYKLPSRRIHLDSRVKRGRRRIAAISA